MNINDFKVEMWVTDHENDCRFNLSETCASPMTLKELLDLDDSSAVIDEMLGARLGYGEIVGSERLRRAIATLYKTVGPERITAAHGASGANSLALMSIVGEGDHVISITPTYQQHYSLPEAMGATHTLIELDEEKGWMPDVDAIRAAVKENTKVICLCNPDNPTGAVIPDKMLMEIVEIARECDAYLFCDEAYRGLSYSGPALSCSVVDIYEKGIVTGSMSKTFALPGLRLGWVAGPADVISEINRHRDYHIISMGVLDDMLAAIALEHKDQILERNIRLCRTNAELIADWVSREPHISFVKPEAATTCFLKFDFDMSSEELCNRLQDEAGVMFVPGSAFDMDDHVRLGFGNETSVIKAGLEDFSEWMRKNIDK